MGLRLPIALVALVALWMLLTDFDPASWIAGLPSVIAAFWAVRTLGGGKNDRDSMLGMLHFIPFFIGESLRGGIDVALRTLSPKMRVRPGFTVFRTDLRHTDALVFLVNCANLLPGTLVADRQGDRVDIHLLDAEVDAEGGLRRLEKAVGRIFPGSL